MDPELYAPRQTLLPPVPRLRAVLHDTFKQPPLDGSLCLSQIYAWHAQNSPTHPVFQYLEDDRSIQTITFRDIFQAINRGGWLLKDAIQKCSPLEDKRKIIAIVALSETISYSIVWLASQHAGFILFPISPRNSPAAVAHLLTTVPTDLLLVGREPSMQDLVNSAFDLMKSANTQVPTTLHMLIFADLFPANSEPVDSLPPLSFNSDDVATIVHSSGSTAFPKPITWTYLRTITLARLPYYGEIDMTGKRMATHSLPMYHGMGTTQVTWAAGTGMIMTCHKPTSPPRICSPGELLREAHALKSDFFFCTPNYPESWSKCPEEIEMLKKARGILFGGGPMAREAGDLLQANGIKLYSVYGCTEFGIMSAILPKTPAEDWEYFSFGKTVRTHWVHNHGGAGVSKLILMSGPLSSPSATNCVVEGVDSFDTNDLFVSHPSIPDLWKVYGRVDDQIMHSIGEKTNPGPLEAILNRDKHIAHALIFGRGRFNIGVLVDPASSFRFHPDDEEKLLAFRNLIWPSVEKMNQYAPQHSRLFKEMIIVSSPNKPFTYTAKGTPRRHAVLDHYAPEIDALYAAVEESTQADLPTPKDWDLEETMRFTRTIVDRVLGHSVDTYEDIFLHGCDSLQATWIRNSLLHALRSTSKADTRTLSINFVYDHPTIAQLAEYVHAAANANASHPTDDTAAIQAMHRMLEKYSARLPTHVPRETQVDLPVGEAVLVTGTTGGLGAALLAKLCDTPEVSRVYALNRRNAVPLLQRQKTVLGDRGYDAEAIMDSSKVVYVEADLGQPRLGLEQHLYEEIQASITHIIHNAWPVNFNLGLAFFESSIKAVRNLADLALSSPRNIPPCILFISSQGVLKNADHSVPIQEELVSADIAVGTGYSESKWVSEQLLALASRETPLRTISLRCGQIAGSRNGAWNTQEWVPSLIKSSIHLGCLPLLPEDISWMNCDDVASVVLEARNASTLPSLVHVAHPRPVPWKTLFEVVSTEYGTELVSFEEWFTKLAASAEDAAPAQHKGLSNVYRDTLPTQSPPTARLVTPAIFLSANPASKLLSFFNACNNASLQGKAVFPTLDVTKSRTIVAKQSMADGKLESLNANDMVRWIRHWQRVGFLPT